MSFWRLPASTALPVSTLLISLVCSSAPARGRDFFLTIGGGGTPSGNQVSLEKNVLYFQRVLRALDLADLRHDILFADGADPGRDLQLIDPDAQIPPANRLLAQLCGQEDGVDDQYRTHEIPGLRGPSTRAEIDRWFDETKGDLGAGDRLLIYFTGHGGKAKNQSENHMHLWNGEKLTAKEMAALLDKLAPEVEVTLVMVQCYSGGFANLIFGEANPEKGATAARRCGFFATTHDRVAAGCTADIDEENYQEYSSYFWSALAGQKRLGEATPRPDYDGDRRTSFEEAHAYALIHSDTIDVSIRTSDALLKAISETKSEGHDELLTADAPKEKLLSAATPVDRAALHGLLAALELEEGWTAEVRKLADELQEKKEANDEEKGKLQSAHRKIAGEVLKALKLKWPEIGNPWNARVTEILTADSPALLAAAEAHPRFSELNQLHERIAERKQESLDLQRRAAKCQRFLATAERVALAANLPKVAKPEEISRYHELLALERSTLAEPPPPLPNTGDTARRR